MSTPVETVPDILQDVNVPHDGRNIHIPPAWIDGLMPRQDALGVALFLLSYRHGEVVTGRQVIDRWANVAEKPLPETIRDMVNAGFLLPVEGFDGTRYRLVHPDRLGPLPTA